jgi:hypothetical protein
MAIRRSVDENTDPSLKSQHPSTEDEAMMIVDGNKSIVQSAQRRRVAKPLRRPGVIQSEVAGISVATYLAQNHCDDDAT